MRGCARRRRSAALVCTAWLAAAGSIAPARAADTAPQNAATTDAAAEKYKQHMTNGVKLFQDKNFAAAIVEFQAAYDAKPKASPLINIALAHKGLFQYPKAIAVLKMAIAKHGDAMDAADRAAAEEAIADMSALLAYVAVRISPAHATISVDGEDQAPGATVEPVPLGPGTHKIAARADGFRSAEEAVTVASGDRSKTVTLQLTPDKGFVRVTAPDAEMAIAIDQNPVARGSWEGFLTPGAHIVQLYRPGGPTHNAQVLVAAGKAQEVRAGPPGIALVAPIDEAGPFSGGRTSAPAAQPTYERPVTSSPPAQQPAPGAAKKGKKSPKPKEPPIRGFYGLAAGTLVLPFVSPSTFTLSDVSGYALGARGGYRFHTVVGLELLLEYSRAAGIATILPQFEGGGSWMDFIVETVRIGGDVRLMSPGHRARFVATLGLGIAYDIASLGTTSADGADVFLHFEQGVEFNAGHALLGLGIQQVASTTSGINQDLLSLGQPFFQLGLGLRVGYSTW